MQGGATAPLTAHRRRGRIKFDAMTGPVDGVVTGNGGNGVPIGHVERQRLRRTAAEIQDGFNFLVVAATEFFRKRCSDPILPELPDPEDTSRHFRIGSLYG
jgi:hypothetical protein